jgi:predicted nucleic acid-binding protein
MAEVAHGRWLILDTGGLLALAAHGQRARALSVSTAGGQIPLVIPSVILAQCIRGGPRDAPINRVVSAAGGCLPVTESLAREAGVLLALVTENQPTSRRDHVDAIDAIVVAIALHYFPASIMTSDADHIRRLLDAAPERGRVQVIAV